MFVRSMYSYGPLTTGGSLYFLRLLFTMFTALNATRHILRESKIRVHPKVGVWHCVSRVQLLVVLDLRRQIEDTHTRLERDLPLQHWKMKRGTFRCHRIFIVVILSSRYIQSETQRNIKRAWTDGWKLQDCQTCSGVTKKVHVESLSR